MEAKSSGSSAGRLAREGRGAQPGQGSGGQWGVGRAGLGGGRLSGQWLTIRGTRNRAVGQGYGPGAG